MVYQQESRNKAFSEWLGSSMIPLKTHTCSVLPLHHPPCVGLLFSCLSPMAARWLPDLRTQSSYSRQREGGRVKANHHLLLFLEAHHRCLFISHSSELDHTAPLTTSEAAILNIRISHCYSTIWSLTQCCMSKTGIC